MVVFVDLVLTTSPLSVALEASVMRTPYSLSDAAVAAGDDHHLVLLGATEEFLAAAFAHALDEDLRFATHPMRGWR